MLSKVSVLGKEIFEYLDLFNVSSIIKTGVIPVPFNREVKIAGEKAAPKMKAKGSKKKGGKDDLLLS